MDGAGSSVRWVECVRRRRQSSSWLASSALLVGACTQAHTLTSDQDLLAAARERMVADQIAARDVHDPRVLAAMREVPRHLFVPPTVQHLAYEDQPVPIGYGQTVSQPYMVALMTALVRPSPADRALEVGTGSGYQAAVLSRLVSHVFTIEIEEPLAHGAERRLKDLGYANVTVQAGDGYEGWPEHAPFDVIVVTAAPDRVPQPLLDQLTPGGRLIIPIGTKFDVQELELVEKDASGKIRMQPVTPVRFVPLRRGTATLDHAQRAVGASLRIRVRS